METKETTEFVLSPTEEPDQVWVLSKASGETYRVDLKDFVCSCADYKFRQAKGDGMYKHPQAASEVYEIESPKVARLPAVADGQAITISQEEIVQNLSTELRDEMIKNFVYAVPDYEREYTDKQGKKKKSRKAGWIDLKATGVRDLAHMVADRYGSIDVGEFRFMDVGDRWIAWRDIRLGNFTSTGFADCSKDREFPFRYLGEVVMRNAYKSIVPKIYQDIFTDKFRQLMRTQLNELTGQDSVMLVAEGKAVSKAIAELTDGELAKELKEAQESKLRLKAAKRQAETTGEKVDATPGESKPKDNWSGFRARAKQLGLSEERACQMLRVNSLEEWTGQGKTIGEAIEVVSNKLSQPKRAGVVAPAEAGEAETGAATPATEAKAFHIDLPWLKESLKAINWSEGTAKSWIAARFKLAEADPKLKGTLVQVIGRLPREQAEEFVKELNRRVTEKPRMI